MPHSPVLIVTGSSRGIGRSAVLASLAHFGANVVAVARSEPALQALREEAERAGHAHERVEVVVGDVTDEGVAERAVKVAVERWGRVDGVVANAGVLEPIGSVATTSVDDWKRLFDVNFFSIITLVQKSLPHLRESNGRIIAVSSGAASKAYRAWGAYGSSKAALTHLVQTLAVEEPDITTIALRPGVVDTEMQATIRSQGGQSMDPTNHARFVTLHESKKLVHPDDVGYVVAALALRAGKEFSGEFVSWDEERLKEFRRG